MQVSRCQKENKKKKKAARSTMASLKRAGEAGGDENNEGL